MRVFRQIFCLKILILLMGLLRDIQTEIEVRSLSRGGWSTGNSGSAAIETTSYALMALAEDQEPVRRKAIDVLLRTQNPDGSWPAFEGDDQKGCWTTSLALIALRTSGFAARRIERAAKWLLDNKGREDHWLWKWKFRTVDRAVQFNPEKYGWPWFPETVSWVIPTAFALIALKQSLLCCRTQPVFNRIQLGAEMLRDRACPGGGWNAGNSVVFGNALKPHIDATSIALLGLAESGEQSPAHEGLNWLRRNCGECSSAYSLAWSALALLMHRDRTTADICVDRLRRVLSELSALNIETLSLSAIAINAAEGNENPFQVMV
jgi:hypothetical protein